MFAKLIKDYVEKGMGRKDLEKYYYNTCAEGYEDTNFKKYNDAYVFIINRLNELFEKSRGKPSRILEIGCGCGIISRRLKCLKGSHLIGIDLSENMIATAKRRVVSDKIERDFDLTYCVGDGYNLEFKNETFDFVIASRIFDVVKNPEFILGEIGRVLRKDGRVIQMTDCHAESDSFGQKFKNMALKSAYEIGKMPFLHSFSQKELWGFFKSSGFEIEETEKIFIDPTIIYTLMKKDSNENEKIQMYYKKKN